MVNRQLSLKFQPLWGLWPLSSSRDNTRTKRMYLKWQIRAGGYVPNHWRVDRHHKAWHHLPRSWSTWRERDETFTGCGTDRRTFTRSNRPSHGHSTHCLRTHARFTWLHWTAWGWCDWSGRTLSPARSRRRCSRRTWKTESNNSRSTSASHCVRELTYEGLFLLDSTTFCSSV